MSVGDLTSDKRGSGARNNEGKADYSYLPLDVVDALLSDREFLTMGMQAADQGDAIRMCGYTMAALGQFHAGKAPAYEVLKMSLCLVAATCGASGAWDALEEVIKVFEFGARKYKRNNWYKGMAWSVPTSCLVRHVRDILRGEETDQESGESHAAHAACNAFMLTFYEHNFPEGDDRPARYYLNGGSTNADEKTELY